VLQVYCETCPYYKQFYGPGSWFYRLDKADRIVSVSETWESFAEENDGLPGCSFASLEGQAVWEHLGGPEVIMIYKKIFTKVRTQEQPVSFRIHCDAVDTIRILQAVVVPLPFDGLEVFFKQLQEKKRSPEAVVAICNSGDDIITMCSYCGDLKDSDGKWKPIEAEVSDRDLFQHRELPKISHGICPTCAEEFLRSIRNYSARIYTS